jgi:hypothetical protein
MIYFLLFSLDYNCININKCCDPNLGLATKTKVCKGASRNGSLIITFHVRESVGECEGMNPHTPKWVFTLGVGILIDLQIFREVFQRSKFIGLKNSLYHSKALET